MRNALTELESAACKIKGERNAVFPAQKMYAVSDSAGPLPCLRSPRRPEVMRCVSGGEGNHTKNTISGYRMR